MFNVCRRGFAPLSRVSAAATASKSLSVIHRQSILPQNVGILYSAAAPSRLFSSSIPRTSEAFALTPQSNEDTTASDGRSSGYITKFQHLADQDLVHKNVINQITKGMGYENMTLVQSMTINETLKGTDIIAQARTGTGKTLGFLIPVVQNILSHSPELAERSRSNQRATASDIRAIIISPTRELAEQLAVEAQKLTAGTGLKVQAAVGGNSKRAMLRQMQIQGCHLLIATPGRLYDLLSDQRSGVAAPQLGFLVLDEADRLLDKGFSEEIHNIIQLLPDIRKKDRQTLLFSATVPREVMHLVQSTLKPNFEFVQTVQKGDAETHQKIPQMVTEVKGMENIMPAILELSKREIEKNARSSMPFKAIVYFNTTAQTNLANAVFTNLKLTGQGSFAKSPLGSTQVFKINAKCTQEYRTRSAERFRQAKSAILLSTDVTARGMDFPNVTHVIQVGLPSDRDTYIHRIGRTGRGDKQGEGWIMVTQEEARILPRVLSKLPLVIDESLDTAKVDMTRDAQLPPQVAATLGEVGEATKTVDRETKSDAFSSCLAHYESNMASKLIRKHDFVDSLNQWTRYGWGWDQPPQVSRTLASKFGLKAHQPRSFGGDRDGGRGGFSDRGGGFGDRGGGGRGGGGFSDRGSGGRSGGGFGDRGSGGRGGSSFGDRGGRGNFGDKAGGRSFGDRGGRGDFSR